MAEINAVEHVARIFAVAQKLMAARQAATLAKLAADEAAKELERINGSERIDLGEYNGRRFFECEGDRETRLKYGGASDLRGEPSWRCPGIIGYDSWEMAPTATRPPDKKAPLCYECGKALENKQRDESPPTQAEAPKKKAKAKDADPEVAF